MADSPRLLLARYLFHGFLKSHKHTPRWLAIDTITGRKVVIALVDPSRATHYEAARAVQHPLLASVLEVVREVDPTYVPNSITAPGGAIAVIAEYVPGRSLHLKQPFSPSKAVSWVSRLIDAVQALHDRGAVHGAISPWAIMAEPEARGAGPVLTHLVASPVAAFCPPERLKGGSEVATDDVWALHATLYAALTGKLPFDGTQRDVVTRQMLFGKPKSLSELGVNDPVLSEILARGLFGEKRLRVTELSDLKQALQGWERDPHTMPEKHKPATRPLGRGAGEVGGPAPHRSGGDDGIIFDAASIPDNESAAFGTVTATHRAMPPPLPGAQHPAMPPLPSTTPARPRTATPPPLPPSSAPVAAAPALSASPAAPSSVVASPATASPIAASPAPATAPALMPPPLADAHTHTQESTLAGAAMSLERMAAQLPRPGAPPAPGVVPHVTRRLSFNPFERKRRVWPAVVSAAVLSGLGVYIAVGGSGSQSAAPASSASAQAAEAPKAKSPEKSRRSASEERDTCVRSYFEEGAFSANQDFGFLCEDNSFKDAAKQLFALSREHAGKKPASARGHGRLGWYELPAAGIIRKSCCSAAAPVSLPQTGGWCEQLQYVVRRIADDSGKAGDLGPDAKSFDKAVTCLFANRIGRPYSYDQPPTQAERRAFQEFLSLAAVTEARR